ncbi:MAG: hypothetical protein KC425_15180 [Anaerolineales bacterium]|nr:hypothetical protein [Anaerolineales bacterium]
MLLFLWRWRTPKYAFVLLWLATFTTPSLVTVDAPSTIRMINLLPFLPLPVAEVMHNLGNFSTKNGRLSTNLVYLGMTALVAAHIWGTGTAVFRTWPRHPEVQFVWQAAFTDMGVFLDANSAIETAVSPAVVTAAIAGWTPATLDVPTMALLLQRPDARLSHFDPLDGTLLLPAPNADGTRTLLRPNILELDPYWESQLAAWHAAVTRHPLFTQYAIRNTPYAPQSPITATFGAELRLRGTTTLADGFITHWEVLAAPTAGRRLFLQWLDAAGNVLAEDYRLDTADPQNLWFPHWQPGDLLLQRHPAPPPGAAQLRLGWFDPATCSPGPCQNLPTAAGEPFLLLP